jgi:hypothetical protein
MAFMIAMVFASEYLTALALHTELKQIVQVEAMQASKLIKCTPHDNKMCAMHFLGILVP